MKTTVALYARVSIRGAFREGKGTFSLLLAELHAVEARQIVGFAAHAVGKTAAGAQGETAFVLTSLIASRLAFSNSCTCTPAMPAKCSAVRTGVAESSIEGTTCVTPTRPLWEYILIRKLIGGQEGEARTTGATFLMAKVADHVATVIGVSKDFLWSACFGQQHGDAWPRFFYSLQFRNAPPAAQAQAAIHQQLVGTWLGGTGDVGLAYVFQPDGHYSSAGGTRNKITGQLIPSFRNDGKWVGGVFESCRPSVAASRESVKRWSVGI